MVDKQIFAELEKLAPEERIKKLKEIEEDIEKEKNAQIKAAEELIEKTNQEMHEESREEKLERLFEHAKNDEPDESLENAVKGQEVENIEEHVQYQVSVNEIDERVNDVMDYYSGNNQNDVYKKEGGVSGSYNSAELKDAATENWKAMGYEK